MAKLRQFDGTGLVVARQRPRANQANPAVLATTTTQYDSVGRILSVNYDDGTSGKSYLYDLSSVPGTGFPFANSKGHLVEANGGGAMTQYQYDAMGRPTLTLQCLPGWCGNPALDKLSAYSYDWLGNVLSASDGAGVTTSYTYTPADEVLSITSSTSNATHPGTLVSNVQNGPFGPQSYQLGNGVDTSFSYDNLGRRNGGWICKGSSQNFCTNGVQLYGYTIGWNGSRAAGGCDTALNRCQNFGYDEFNRLTSQTDNSGTGQNFNWVYDRNGNRWQQNPNGVQVSYNASNQIATGGYTYDAAGNLLSDGVNTYSYDAEGNLAQEVTASGPVKNTYDALNQLIRTDYLNAGVATLNVFNVSGQLSSLWLSSNQSLLLGKAYWGQTALESYSPSNNMAYFQHRDWIGTERIITDANGNVTDVRAGMPFGDNAVTVSGTRDNSYDGFTGLWDGATASTNHAQYREYSNVQGRWLQPDPYNGSYDFSNPQSCSVRNYLS